MAAEESANADNPQPPTPEDAATTNADEGGSAEKPKSTNDRFATIAGVVIWALLIGGFLTYRFWGNNATVMVDVSRGDAFVVAGTVVYDGKAVTDGNVHVVVVDARNKRYVAGAVVPTKDGAFTTAGQTLLVKKPLESTQPPLRVIADYEGTSEGTKGDKKSIKGTATAYVDFEPPLDAQTLTTLSVAPIVLIIILTALFTGDLTRRKARTLFAVTYLMTFLSLAVPIVLTILVSQSTYLVRVMREAPIGLVKGTSKGVLEPQWLVNIGGSVERELSVGTVSTEPVAENAPDTARAGDAAQSSPAPARALSAPAPPASGVQAVSAAPATAERQESGTVTDVVKGGLAVPFYVVMLAMLGAGINMTRKVPPVQIKYETEVAGLSDDRFLAAAFKAPLSWLSLHRHTFTPLEREATADIRKNLIENYMYLLSAPFLAIAVYYLLQAIGSNPAEPVLVLMAFSTGLLADKIIDKIRGFAEDTLGGQQPSDVAGTQVKHEETTVATVVRHETTAATATGVAALADASIQAPTTG